MIVGKIGKKGQVVIPKEIRDKLRITPNDVLSFQVHDNDLIVRKVPDVTGESLVDLLERCKPFPAHFIRSLREEWS